MELFFAPPSFNRQIAHHVSVVALFSAALAGCGGSSNSQSPPSISGPASVMIHPGDQNISVTVQMGPTSGVEGPFTVTVTGLPSGITATSIDLNPSQSGSIDLNATSAADQGAFGRLGTTSDTKQVSIAATAGPTQVTTSMALTVSLSNPSFKPDPSKMTLPVVTIDTGGTAIVDKATGVPGTITITSADGQTSFLPNSNDADNTATFHLHGHTTLAMPKKPYHVKLNTSLDLLAQMGLSCPYGSKGKNTCDKSKSYILLANYDDKTLLRDWSASALANSIPIGAPYLDSAANSPSPGKTLMPWAPHSLFVELFLNGEYEGNYQLIEEVKVDSHRVNINELDDTDIAPADVTGGYLLEIDNYQDETFAFKTPKGLPIGLDDPDFSPDPQVPEQTSYISNYLIAAESALFASNFTDPVQGWRAYFDEASVVNFYIVNEVMGNYDGGVMNSSDYLYKDKNNPLLYMGPIWDFDVSSGNINFSGIVNPTTVFMQGQSIWYKQFFYDPGFRADVIKQWNTLKSNGVFDQWIASIKQQAVALKQSQQNNFARWPMLGVQVWPNPQAAGSYDAEVAYLTNWLNLRIAYLDSQFNGKAPTATSLDTPTGNLQSGSPVTLTAHVLPTGLGGAVSFTAANVLIGTTALDGTGTATLTTSNLPSGSVVLEAIYSGTGAAGLSASNLVTVTVLSPMATESTTAGTDRTVAHQLYFSH